MNVGIIGTGFIGTTLGAALARAGNQAQYGSRHPDDLEIAEDGDVVSVGDAVAATDVVLLAVQGAAVAEAVADCAGAMSGTLVIDTTNR